jgi:hypothetical protein
VVHDLTRKIRRRLKRYQRRIIDFIVNTEITEELVHKDYIEEDFLHIKENVINSTRYLLPRDSKEKIVGCIRRFCPNAITDAINKADRICGHNIKLFGKDYQFGEKINWHKDIESEHEWPLKHASSINIINLKDNSDVKFPWELSRFHHAVTLGKAYWFTRNEKYVVEFVRQVYSWIASNPPGKGINWNCTMEVSIRMINLIWVYCFFQDSSSLSDRFHITFYNFMLAHGKHIFNNLENKGGIKNNHYIANLLGLLYIGKVFPVFRYSNKWREYALMEIHKEMEEQVCHSGTSYEFSISYHRFVAEMFFHAVILTKKFYKKDCTVPEFDDAYMCKLEKMIGFISSYTKPDGFAPQIGDNDSGRMLVLGNPDCDINNHLHMLAIAGEYFNRDDFRCAGREHYEEAIWLFDGNVKIPMERGVSINSKAYKDSGFYVMRHNKDYLIVRGGKLGTGGKGTHTHNDNLSFELCSDGISYIIDPGTYTYSRDPAMRNLFRSTGYHNTLFIAGAEQNFFSERDLFLLCRNSETRTLVWETGPEKDIFAGEIIVRLSDEKEVLHKREIIFRKRVGLWEINDCVLGDIKPKMVWHFHLNEGVNVEVLHGRVIFYAGEENPLILEMKGAEGCNIEVMKAWHSPSYDVKRETRMVNIGITAELPKEVGFNFIKGRR